MRFRPYAAILVSMIFALAVGFFVSGDLLYQAFIGLDPTAFLAGPFFQAIGKALLPPGLDVTVASVVMAIGSLLLLAIVVFFLVRGAVRAKVTETDPGRRGFLTGAASGAGAGPTRPGGCSAACWRPSAKVTTPPISARPASRWPSSRTGRVERPVSACGEI